MGASNSSVAECEYAAKEEDTARKPALDMPATPHTLPPSPPASSLRGKENDGNTVLPNTVEKNPRLAERTVSSPLTHHRPFELMLQRSRP
jgi:hypothetical protein